jgi:hypothetical protein
LPAYIGESTSVSKSTGLNASTSPACPPSVRVASSSAVPACQPLGKVTLGATVIARA